MSIKNDVAWSKLIKENNILSEINYQGFSKISASIMRKYREPRLMAKIDTSVLLPRVFKKNKLSILPVRNGEYILFLDPQMLCFCKFPCDLDSMPIEKHIPAIQLSNFDSFTNLENLNESQALDIALMSSIIKDFTEEENLFLTIRGRQFSKDFQVFIPSINKQVSISKVQIEVDAGYESQKAIYLFEAKIGKREDYNLRQLLFPYLEWKKRTTKDVIPIFTFFTNGFYYLFQFEFSESLETPKLIKQKCYSLSDIQEFDLKQTIEESDKYYLPEKNIPFPQANDLDKVVDVVSVVNQGYETKWEISEIFEFDERQGDYYGNAASYIGFLTKKEYCYSLTKDGAKLLNLESPSKRAKLIVELLIEKDVFNQIFKLLLQKDLNVESLNQSDISSIIQEYTDLKESTANRRASTVKQWLRWISKYAK